MKKNHGLSIGIESKIEYNPILEAIGISYESWRRTAINWLQKGLTEIEVEKRLQSEFNLQWAWADSIATEASQTYDQLTTAKANNIAELKIRIKEKAKKSEEVLKDLTAKLSKPFKTKVSLEKFQRQLLGLESKIKKLNSLKQDLQKLENTSRLHICFGSKKLFNAQHHLEENNYLSKEDWLTNWQKKRSGRFYCIGKAAPGGGTMLKVISLNDSGEYKLLLNVPRPLQNEFGKIVHLNFTLEDRLGRYRRSDLNYALSENKPITTQVFRREHKEDQWYIHLTTYVQEVPLIFTKSKGCIGLDFNKDSISASYIKPDGNLGNCIEFEFKWKGLTAGQRQARMRDVVSDIIKVAEAYECAIAIEALDFSKKKAAMSEESKLYNEMLSNLSTSLFKTTLESKCKRHGIELLKVNPAFTSIIGMISYMAKYGLNSGTSAAMVIARRALNLSEKIPKCLLRPEDQDKHSWSSWNRVARFIKLHKIKRTQLFQWKKVLEGILIMEHSPSLLVNIEKGDTIINLTKSPCC